MLNLKLVILRGIFPVFDKKLHNVIDKIMMIRTIFITVICIHLLKDDLIKLTIIFQTLIFISREIPLTILQQESSMYKYGPVLC